MSWDQLLLDSAESGLVVIQPDGRRTKGVPPVLAAKNVNCEECGQVHDLEKCPLCGGWIELGYGLAFGGCGAYKYCPAEGCGWFHKEFDDEGMEQFAAPSALAGTPAHEQPDADLLPISPAPALQVSLEGRVATSGDPSGRISSSLTDVVGEPEDNSIRPGGLKPQGGQQ